MSPIAFIVAYALIGFCTAAYRAYSEPRMARDYYLKHGWYSLLAWKEGNGEHIRTFAYPECLAGHFVAWPIVLVVVLVGRCFNGFRERGQRALQRQIDVEHEQFADEAEIDRIIREAKL